MSEVVDELLLIARGDVVDELLLIKRGDVVVAAREVTPCSDSPAWGVKDLGSSPLRLQQQLSLGYTAPSRTRVLLTTKTARNGSVTLGCVWCTWGV